MQTIQQRKHFSLISKAQRKYRARRSTVMPMGGDRIYLERAHPAFVKYVPHTDIVDLACQLPLLCHHAVLDFGKEAHAKGQDGLRESLRTFATFVT